MADPLPTLMNEHTWATIKNTPTARHHLIPVGMDGSNQSELLDWIESTGQYDVWVGASSPNSTGDPYMSTPRTSGSWLSIKSGHVLIYLAEEPGNWFAGNVMDWVPSTMVVRIWRLDRMIKSGDPLPTKLNESSFQTIGSGHQLIYLDHDRVLDWEPGSGHSRVWQYDRSRTTKDPLPTKVTDFTWSTIRTGHQLVYLGGDLLLDWNEATSNVRVWRYDRSLSGAVDPLPLQECDDSWSGKIAGGRVLHYLGGDLVLDWDPATGHERIWDFDRPMMPTAQFTIMLTSDIATASNWVAAAQTALVAYQNGLVTGVHDANWLTIDAALTTHFHAQAHPSGVQAAVAAIQETYKLILARLSGGTSSFTPVSKAKAISDVGGRGKYVRGYSVPGMYSRLTPAYRPFDTIGRLSLDGAGPKLRAAILIHEATHFVGNNPDSAFEWQPTYATLAPQLAVTNPASYATFAHHVLTGKDLRFGIEPWQ